jgi:hypothetical protein
MKKNPQGFPPDLTQVLCNMKAKRQVEALELMIASNGIMTTHAEALLKAAPSDQRNDCATTAKFWRTLNWSSTPSA